MIGPLIGTVVSVPERSHQYIVVECPEAPVHLQTLHLVPWQARSAKLGDRVKLEYRSTNSWGAWVITHILGDN